MPVMKGPWVMVTVLASLFLWISIPVYLMASPFQSSLIMLGHHNDSSLKLLSSLADESSDGVVICGAGDDFHTV